MAGSAQSGWIVGLGADGDDQLDLDRRAERQAGHPDRAPGVLAGPAEDLAEHVTGAVRDLRMVR